MSDCIFLCSACNPNPGEVKTLGIPRRECGYCGAICSNVPGLTGLPPGELVALSEAPPPHALSEQERAAQVRPVEPQSEPQAVPAPHVAPVSTESWEPDGLSLAKGDPGEQ